MSTHGLLGCHPSHRLCTCHLVLVLSMLLALDPRQQHPLPGSKLSRNGSSHGTGCAVGGLAQEAQVVRTPAEVLEKPGQTVPTALEGHHQRQRGGHLRGQARHQRQRGQLYTALKNGFTSILGFLQVSTFDPKNSISSTIPSPPGAFHDTQRAAAPFGKSPEEVFCLRDHPVGLQACNISLIIRTP